MACRQLGTMARLIKSELKAREPANKPNFKLAGMERTLVLSDSIEDAIARSNAMKANFLRETSSGVSGLAAGTWCVRLYRYCRSLPPDLGAKN